MIMSKIHNNLSPSYLRQIFTNTSIVHAHNLSNSEINCYAPRPTEERNMQKVACTTEDLSVEKDSLVTRHLPSLVKTSLNGKDYY